MADLLGVNQLFDPGDFWKLVARLGFDVLFAALLIFGVYYRKHRNREYVFTCAVINVITFLLCFLLRKVPVELGFALGLFAVFGILRYRTEPIRIRDLTYLFVAIGIAIVNAVANKKTSVGELALVNVAVVAAAAILEALPLASHGGRRAMLYDRIALLAPGREVELPRDLAARTGLRVDAVQVERMDLLRDAAEITVHFAGAAAVGDAASAPADGVPARALPVADDAVVAAGGAAPADLGRPLGHA